MAVKLSSDLILDVMRNADPARRNAAVARLQSLQGSHQPAFANAMDGLKGPQAKAASEHTFSFESTLPSGRSTSPARGEEKSGAYQGFERLVLRNLFETLLPDENSGTYGGGPSAGVWRSMAADQLAGVYSASGGLGSASMLESSKASGAPEREAQWPYFSVSNIKTFSG
ncbi:rod-binding protein [Aestuariivirga sp.]|uniref:rod-binding protein n=1 Tax=Aestuariivirga sp. TaxID=2650926 RepID=UPI003BAA63A2